MSTDTNFNIDVNKLISDVFGGDKERNDLAVGIKNETNEDIIIDYYIYHGSSKDVSGGNKVHQGELWECGVHAKGAGSNISFSISLPNGSGWAIMAATPVNKENYFKVSHNKDGYESGKDAYKAANRKGKNYSGDGYYDEEHNSYYADIAITGESPAACTIVITKG